MKFELLLEQKKSNKKPKEGDVFVLNPKENLFCFGKVIMTNVESRDSFVNGMDLIFIYDYFSKTEDVPQNLEQFDILLVEVINHQLWKKGYAKTISFSEVTQSDLNENFGFWDMLREEYVNLKGDPVDKEPKYKGIYGLGSYGIIGKEIHEVISKRDF